MTTAPTPLYKRTATGAIQVWLQEIRDDGIAYRTVSGQQDGAKVASEWTVVTPKNVGRANETSLPQQCAAEVASNYRKKLDTGYVTDAAKVDEADYYKPMLAKDVEDYWAKVDEALRAGKPVFEQPKLDGIRNIAMADGNWSRNGKPIVSVPHVSEALAALFEKDPELKLDGELYADCFADNFNAIVSLAKKTKPTAADLEQSRRFLQYHVYDMPMEAPFSQRHDRLKELVNWLGHESIVLVDTTQVRDREHLDERYSHHVTMGREGQMVRLDGPGYENKRTSALLKRKDFKDGEFRIVGVEEGLGNRSGMAGFLICALPDGRTFKSNLRGDRAYMRDVLVRRDQLVGKDTTIRYFMLTPDGIPRFPVSVAIHETERM